MTVVGGIELPSVVPNHDGGGEDVEDLERLLQRIDLMDPSFGAERLALEVDDLLGRAKPGSEPATRKLRERPTRRAQSNSFDWYARMVGAIPLLDPERTRQAAAAVEIGLLAEERLAGLEIATTTRREVSELNELVAKGREEYRLLIVANLRLVFHWSKGVASSIDEDWAQDAFQAGCLGLMRGLQGWDHAKGFALSTLVSWNIRQAIQRWRANDVLLIRIPVHVWEGLDSVDGLTPELRAAASRAQNIFCLDEIDPESVILESDGGIQDLGDRVDRRRLVLSMLDALSEKEAEVLRLRFGLSDFEYSAGQADDAPMTLDAIGEVFGVTRERIRQIERKALEKLRSGLVELDPWREPA
ncbi:sigma-70 family RNA polymerase sigma factor [Cryobacterium sp. TMT2-42-4]|uniref:sigma-70 family RNA polymerase sigma factor n=1 Tax=Cryobacterium sp. TMT2-42-4 TaxID=1259255 RepID=UPI0010696FE8|nr:sigma-70 family RNA polymerase sigma factor [Cryobacterium sp. TMT2-42-4]TFC34130.1 sigma-70 family RNA polymerase sigma factor [Cryobacterium sp. TMT2-42-4]